MDLEMAQKLYDSNLSKLLDKVREKRRGVYRVMMDSDGLIVSISPCRPGKPQTNCFTLLVSSDVPKFGSLAGLHGYQVKIAQLLEQDMLKVLRANEAAYVLKNGKSPVLDRTVQRRVDELQNRFGSLPEPAIKQAEEAERLRKIHMAQQEEEKQQIWNEAVPDFEELLRMEMKQALNFQCSKPPKRSSQR